MTAEMRPLSFEQLLTWALAERASAQSVYGVPASLFYLPHPEGRFLTRRPFGTPIATPFGPAAGPHTQLAQNIVSAWLCGGRFIELKTVQVLDRLEIPRPCILAADEGYNVEWSQELSLDQSASEYAHAWALVHVLPHALGFPACVDPTLFNLSVGYTLDGVRSPAVQRFLDRMENARELLDPVRRTLAARFPAQSDVDIPDRISDSVTLSTMHGCPPEEIERIAHHLLADRGLHVVVKLNPTLLGRERVDEILHGRLGFVDLDVPDDAFAHDLRFDACLDLIAALRSTADRYGRRFAVKLSNTLAMRNPRGGLAGDMVYMSGRALYPLTVTLFRELRRAVGPDLAVSYSAGADSVNAVSLLAAGACPVTAATDFLKPGGYGRLHQYIERLGGAMDEARASSLDAFAADADNALARAADDAIASSRYRRSHTARELPKLASPLPLMDCVVAPCVATCPACQDVPTYVAHLADGHWDSALAAVLVRNPLPGITGHICTARCESRCTRANVDRPVRIRDLKRFAAERGRAERVAPPALGPRVAVIGAGPSGLAAAAFLARSGVHVVLFEERARAGGMPAIAPAFRIPAPIVDADVAHIAALGVEIRTGRRAPSPQDLRANGFDAVYIACGYPFDAPLRGVTGLEARGVLGALDFLRRVADGAAPEVGPRVLVVGGGNTAIDAARTALRLASSVAVLYRRTRAEMPADPQEVADFLSEGGTLLELTSPAAAVSNGDRLVAVDCIRNRLGPADPDGRSRPIPMPETLHRLPADTLIRAVGQAPGLPEGGPTADPRTGATGQPGVYAGGDAVRGPSTIIEAVADARRAAAAICDALGIPFLTLPLPPLEDLAARAARARTARAERHDAQEPARLPISARRGFSVVTATLDESQARAEAARCLQCQLVCDKCVDVCPNRANQSIVVRPLDADAPAFDLATGAPAPSERVCIAQSRQIVHVIDLCNECGNCATFCVYDGRPSVDKLRLALTLDTFAAAEGSALCATSDGLRGKAPDGAWTLRSAGDGFLYADDCMEIALSRDLEVTDARVTRRGSGSRSVASALRAAVVYRSLRESPLWSLVEGAKGDME